MTSESAPADRAVPPRPAASREVPRPLPGSRAARVPRAGRPGHGRAAIVRRQAIRMADGRRQGGYTGLFELICPDCGDQPGLDYLEVTPQLRAVRGPRPLHAAVTEFGRHAGLAG